MTTYYADSVNGLNTNPGTEALPFATLSKLISSIGDGDAGLLSKNCIFDIFNGFGPTISQKKNITIGAYGTGELPAIDAMVYENSNSTGWVSEGGGVFSKLIGNGSANTDVRRLFIGASKTGNLRSQRSIGTAMRRAKRATLDTIESIKANLNADDIWWQAGSDLGYKLYVFTESGNTSITPPAFYNGLAFNAGDYGTIGAPNSILIRECDGVWIQDIEGWGNLSASFLAQSEVDDEFPTQNIVIRNCVSRYPFGGGFKAAPFAQNSALPKLEVNNVLVQYCTMDMCTSAKEQEPSTTEYGYLTNVTDAFSFLDTAKNCRAEYCTAINSMHVSFTMGTYSDNRTLTDRCGFYGCKAKFDTWHAYGRAVTAYNCSSSCYVMYCDFDGQSICSQINGAAYVYRNVWRNMKVSVSKANVSHAIAITAEVLNRNTPALGDDMYVRNFPTRVRFIENIFQNPVGPIIRMTAFSYPDFPVADPVIADGTVDFLNNICLHGNFTYPWFQVEIGGSTVGLQNLRNNAVFTGVGNPVAKERVNNVDFSFNTAPGCRENISQDPLVDMSNPSKISLSPASPCRYAGYFTFSRDESSYTRPNIGPFQDSLTFQVM